MQQKKCPKCGKNTYSASRDMKYCINCGENIEDVKAETAGVKND